MVFRGEILGTAYIPKSVVNNVEKSLILASADIIFENIAAADSTPKSPNT